MLRKTIQYTLGVMLFSVSLTATSGAFADAIDAAKQAQQEAERAAQAQLAAQQAERANLTSAPPGTSDTYKISAKMESAEEKANNWQRELVRQLANFNAFTREKDSNDIAFVKARNKFCTNKNGKAKVYCTYYPGDEGADVLASTLVDTKAYTTDNERKAALAFIQNMSNPMPLAYPDDDDSLYVDGKKDKGLTDEGIQHFAAIYRQMPLISATQNALLGIFADRDRVEVGEQFPVGEKGWASVMEVIDFEVQRRYMDEAWAKRINEKSNELAVLREIANMMAFQQYLDYKAYEQNARMATLIAAQTSAINQLQAMMTQSTMDASGLSVEGEIEEQGG